MTEEFPGTPPFQSMQAKLKVMEYCNRLIYRSSADGHRVILLTFIKIIISMISIFLKIIFAFAKLNLDKIVHLHKNNFQMDYGIQ